MHTAYFLKISRPRFWLYTAGPYLIGLAAAARTTADLAGWWQWTFLLFFLFPANLLVYGINDIFDYETDKRNPKKASYETLVGPAQRSSVWAGILLTVIPFTALCFAFAGTTGLWYVLPALAGFLFFSIFYSAPPIRAKTKPFLDSIFNILYLFPGWFGFFLLGGTGFNWQLFLAGALWVMAMHAYSAVPDITADNQAHLPTIATTLGPQTTLVLCGIWFIAATALALPYIGLLAVVLGLAYALLILISMAGANTAWVFKVYTWFPLVNACAGFAIFIHTALRLFAL
ncbi:MAG: prenyltransferase [Candidatus Doudnabacteria bacterium]|nr:prenyltransferase [Candidatus Doudnabacteria bacterium]